MENNKAQEGQEESLTQLGRGSGGNNLQAENVVGLTEAAAAAVKRIITEEGIPEGARIRVSVKGGGCAGFYYDMDFAKRVNEEGKETFSMPGDPIRDMDAIVICHGVEMVVDKMSLMYLAGATIDYITTLQGTGFKFNNPQTSHTCGCGNSFAV